MTKQKPAGQGMPRLGIYIFLATSMGCMCLQTLAEEKHNKRLTDAELREQFQRPPPSVRPWCYWYWLFGDITKEGITKDLETMSRVGIRLAMIGNIFGPEGAGASVKMFSPEWYVLTRHALSEAHRVGVEIYMFNSPGWSQSGGPWIKPQQAMRRVMWNEIDAAGGKFSDRVRNERYVIDLGAHGGIGKIEHEPQDIAVLAIPKKQTVSISGVRLFACGDVSFNQASWIWSPSENAAKQAPAGTRYFRRVFEVDPAALETADIMVTADNSYVVWVNGQEAGRGENWQAYEPVSILKFLKSGANVIGIAASNAEPGAAGLIASVALKGKDGKEYGFKSDASWQVGTEETAEWKTSNQLLAHWPSAEVLGAAAMSPWGVSSAPKNSNALIFRHGKPFTARALVIKGYTHSKLYAVHDGKRELLATIRCREVNRALDFLPDGIETFSLNDVTAQEFALDPCGLDGARVTLTSEPKIAQVTQKQMGWMHPNPSPTWESYIFPDTVEPGDADSVIKRAEILNLSDKLRADGVLECTLPPGAWTILYFGMVPTLQANAPAPREATGLEVDKMSRQHIEHHFNSMFGELLKQLTPEERAAWTGITIDSYERGSQNWTDGFDKAFKERNGYDPIAMLPVFTGRVVESAKASDQFLWDLRRTVADRVATEYVAGLRDIAHKNKLRLWCENYGHWGFPSDFLIYGAHADEIGGEFWSWGMDHLGPVECRAASSCGHIYGRQRIYCEAFTSALNLDQHPYLIKSRGEQMFCEGVNHFVLHVYAHQARDGVPGRNPPFGTAFHRNTPWFNQSRDWVKYLQRVHFMLQQGQPVADVAVYIGDFAPQMTGPANPVPAGYDYDYIGSDALLKTVKMKDKEMVVYDEKNPERISTTYRVLVVSPQADKTVRPNVRKRLEELKAAKIPFVNQLPPPADKLRELGISPLVSGQTCSIRWKVRKLEDGMIFFLSNFGKTGTFEATLRVKGKRPELYNPATGQITKIARYQSVEDGTRICIDVKDRSDSFFVVFLEEQSRPSVVKVEANGAAVAPGELALYYDEKGTLTAEGAKQGRYSLTMNDGTRKSVNLDRDQTALPVAGPWQSTNQDEKGHTILLATTFSVPAGFGREQRLYLDLGKVSIMAKVTLNGKAFETLWIPPFVLDVTEAVKSGENKLQVLVTSTSNGKPSLGHEVQLLVTPVLTILN